VLKVLSGQYDWGYTDVITGSGIGFQHTFGYSEDSGSTWYAYDTYPFMMKVEATPVPPTVLLLGSGLLRRRLSLKI